MPSLIRPGLGQSLLTLIAASAVTMATVGQATEAMAAQAVTTQITASPDRGTVRLPGETAHLPAGRFRVPTTTAQLDKSLTVTLTLRRTDQAGFDRYLSTVDDPSSPTYHHFLSQAQLANRFGPSATSYHRVLTWLRSQGLHLTLGSANRLTITVRGTRAQAQAAFSTRIADYRVGHRSLFAATSAPAVPATLAADIQDITGLSDLTRPVATPAGLTSPGAGTGGAPQAKYLKSLGWPNVCIDAVIGAVGDVTVSAAVFGVFAIMAFFATFYAGLLLLLGTGAAAGVNLAGITGTINSFTDTGLCVAYLMGDYRGGGSGAAGLGSHARRAHVLSASNAKIGLLEFDTFSPSDVADWLDLAHALPGFASRVTETSVNGGVPTPGPGEREVLLDIDTAILADPESTATYAVYDAPQSTSYQQILNAMINDGVTVISNSWEQCEDQTSLADAQSIDSVIAQAAASGIAVLNGSGDDGSTCFDGSPNTVGVPADSPHATAVGGTSPTVGPGLSYQSETWWGAGSQNPPTGAGGFGTSQYFPRPSYQDGLTAAPMRSIPDVAVDADPRAGLMICQADDGGCPTGLLYGGTSMAAPEMAGLVAWLETETGQLIGNLNAALYPLAGTAAFHSAASMGSDFSHVGLGSPNIGAIALALTGTTPGPVSPTVSLAKGTTAMADGTSQAVVRADLLDANGFAVSGKTVTLTPDSNTATVSAASGPSDAVSGTVTWTVTDTVPETVTFTVTDTTDGVTLSTRPTVTFSAPVATGAQIYGGPSTVSNDGTSTATITVYLENGLDHPAAGKTVSLTEGGGNAVITPQGASSPATTTVTDNNGNATFTVTDTSTEAVSFSAVDTTDGNLAVPGSVLVNFTPGGTPTCVTDLPTAANGYSVSAFATGFAHTDETIVYPGNFTEGACTTFESAPAFDSSGNAYIADSADGTIHVLGPTGGAADMSNQLPDANFPGGSLGQLAFGKDGSLYAGLIQSNGSVTNPEIVQLDPATGATKRIVASSASGLPDCPFVLAVDPLSGDLFTDDECSGYAGSNQISRISDPAGQSPTVSDYLTTAGCNLGMAFAPDGTLYLANCNGEIDQIGGTNTSNPTPTKVADASGAFSVAVTAADPSGHATSLMAYSFDGHAIAIDLTTNPATATPAATGSSHYFITATGANGCGYGTIPGSVVRIGPPGCSTATATNQPSISLAETGSPTPPTGTTVSFTATLDNVASPAGTPVQFSVTGPNLAGSMVRADGSGQASMSYSGAFQGIDTVVASTVVNGTTITSAPLQVHWTAGKATTFLDVNDSPVGGPVGQPVTLTADLYDVTQSPAAPVAGRSVTLGVGGQTCQSQTNATGVASCQVTPQTLGLLALTGNFAGDGTYTPASSSTYFDATTPPGRSTSTSVSCVPGSVPTGSPTTCTATVTDTATGTPSTPTGSVSFTSDSSGSFTSPGTTCPLTGSGASASCQVSYTPTTVGNGTHTITAAYGGDTNHAASNGSARVTVTSPAGNGGGGGGGGSGGVQTATATALASSLNPAQTGQPVTYTATVTPTPTGGTVTFLDGGAPITGCGSVEVDAAGAARCTTSYGHSGSHDIQAAYSGAGLFTASQSPTLTEVVAAPSGPPPPTGTTSRLRSSANPGVTGQRITYLVTVTPAPTGGTVTFLTAGHPIIGCRARALHTGRATCPTTYATPGSQLIQATYSGSNAFTGSQTPTLIETIRWSLTLLGKPSGTGGHARLRLHCAARSGGCLTTLVVAQKRHGTWTRVGAKTRTLGPGTTRTLTIPLNHRGRRWLTHHKRLFARLTISLALSAHRHIVITRRLVIHRKPGVRGPR